MEGRINSVHVFCDFKCSLSIKHFLFDEEKDEVQGHNDNLFQSLITIDVSHIWILFLCCIIAKILIEILWYCQCDDSWTRGFKEPFEAPLYSRVKIINSWSLLKEAVAYKVQTAAVTSYSKQQSFKGKPMCGWMYIAHVN